MQQRARKDTDIAFDKQLLGDIFVPTSMYRMLTSSHCRKLSMLGFKAVNIIFATSNANASHANRMVVNQLLHLFVSHS